MHEDYDSYGKTGYFYNRTVEFYLKLEFILLAAYYDNKGCIPDTSDWCCNA